MKAIENITTYIGKDTEFEGKLRFYGTIRIDGQFRGEIIGEGTLIVGEGATIESDIHVSQIFNSGRIQGDVTADNKIEIRAPGKILGNIQAPSIVINEGATIEGNCQMHGISKKEERKLAVVGSDESEAAVSSSSSAK
ncbi:MAG: polymer-forming cytoskeletal protein [Desulfobacteraceae bacterium]